MITEKKINFIEDNFPIDDIEAVKDIIISVYQSKYNVGNEQLVKSLLFLSEGSLEILKSFFPIADPRDIVFKAQMDARFDSFLKE